MDTPPLKQQPGTGATFKRLITVATQQKAQKLAIRRFRWFRELPETGRGGTPGCPQATNPRLPAPIYTQWIFQMTRLEKLKQLEDVLTDAMAEADPKSLASLARQYRETLKEIEEIEGADDNDDDIGQLLAQRDADGKAGAVR